MRATLSDISKVDYLAGNWAARTYALSPAFRRSSTTSMYLATCAARTVCSMAGTYLAQPGRTALRSTPLRAYLPPLASAGGRPPMALPAATCRQTSSTQSQPETTPKAAPSDIRATVSRIEYDTGKKAQAKWRELYPDTELAGLFVAKVDMSKIPMDELQASLPAFERLLLAHSYGIYCIDYTQDFSGVLDREMLVDHLCPSEGFCEQGDLASAMHTDEPIGEHR